MRDNKNINIAVGNYLKSKIVATGISYKELSERLNKIGVRCTEGSIANKLNRGTFSASFYIQCLSEIGYDSLDVQEIKKLIK